MGLHVYAEGWHEVGGERTRALVTNFTDAASWRDAVRIASRLKRQIGKPTDSDERLAHVVITFPKKEIAVTHGVPPRRIHPLGNEFMVLADRLDLHN